MSKSPVNTILDAIKEEEDLFKFKPSDIDENKAIKDLFGVEEPKLEFSTQAKTVPTKDSPVGQSRIKETEMKAGKTGKTFLGLSNTASAVKTAKKLGSETGEILTATDQIVGDTTFSKAPDSVQQSVQSSRPYIEGDAKLKAGEVFPEPKVNKAGQLVEGFEDYFNRVKNVFENPLKIVALKNEIAKQYAIRYPEYKNISKNIDLIERGLFDFDPNTEKVKGLKIPDRKNIGVKKVVTEALETNEGYVTKINSIDKVIEDTLKKNLQKSTNDFAVRLIGQMDPDTGRPFTPAKIQSLIAQRINSAGAVYTEALKKDITATVMNNLKGKMSMSNLDQLAKNEVKKVAPKKIAAFTTALAGIIKSGNASDLLLAGTKASGIGLGLELLLPNRLEAATLFDPTELEENYKLSAREDIKKKFGEPSIEGGIFDLKEGQTVDDQGIVDDRDIYERAGVESFPSYFFQTLLGRKNIDR